MRPGAWRWPRLDEKLVGSVSDLTRYLNRNLEALSPWVADISARRGFNFRADFNAKGDNSADDTEAMLEFMDAAPQAGAMLFIEGPREPGDPATYVIDSAVISKPNIHFWGPGARFLKKPTTVTHMFIDHAAAADGFRSYGLRYNMNRAAGFAVYGQSNSAFSFNRARDLGFIDSWVEDGVEEGIRCAKCQFVWVVRGGFLRLMDNGVEFLANDGSNGYFTGTRPDQDAKHLWCTEGTYFEDIQDSYLGAVNGCAVAIGGGTKIVTDVNVRNTHIFRCSRGLWSETNGVTRNRRINFDDNDLVEIEYAGIGHISAEDSSACRNRITDLGVWTAGDPAPPDPTALGFSPIEDNGGIFVSGGPGLPSKSNRYEGNILRETRAGAARKWMYGFVCTYGDKIPIGRNTIEGMLVKDYISRDWTFFTNSSVVPSPRPHVDLTHSATQNVFSGVPKTLAFDGERQDTAGFHDTAVNNTRLTIPVPGRYKFKAGQRFPYDAGLGYRSLQIVLNGAVVIGEDTKNAVAVAGVPTWVHVATPDRELRAADTPLGAPADYVELVAIQDSGAVLALATNDVGAYFSAELIDGAA